MKQDKQKDHRSSEAREARAALMEMSTYRWAKLSKDFVVEFEGFVNVDVGPSKKKSADKGSW